MRSTKTVIIAILAVLVALSFGEAYSQNRKKVKVYPESPAIVDSEEYATMSGGESVAPKESIDWDIVDLDTLTLFPKHLRPQIYPKYHHGDMRGLQYEVEKHLQIPKTLRAEMRAQSLNFVRVFVLFIVEKDGSVSDVKCYRSGFTERETNHEVVKMLEPLFVSKGSWTPGSHNGRVVRTEICMPVDFRLNF
ncbi:MAG: hypothetical protein IJW42_06190 [Alistipes sp.]|nr:hypothetical protein [Alistipes sp.]